MGVQILLDLTDHCIQTAAKHEYERVLATLLADAPQDEATEERLALLTEFLETADFRALRADHAELRDGSGEIVRLGRTPDGIIEWSVADD
jgi:hypothetical protein